eukprot:Protomagalhaensia_wolfi_Nauph_80__530@NODE_12_length_5322_cov_729_645845_g9_i0_p2_GENE_NODE_12_length_5322_cov_729_645845_g9_i0NODE_12_length_5322_cov_729_645845_g9_i0_p2_ORF_typecomplete_len302_score33_52Acyltransferase/PF01553_21/6_8e03Acyltransferase/PF01553_21/8_9e20_NODE_12_length_5322_cov_729_645845_g9_i011682073
MYSSLSSQNDGSSRYSGPVFLRIIATSYFYTAVALAFFFSFLTQLIAWALLFPVYLAKPAFCIKTQGQIFRFYQNLASYYLNPFWSIKIVRKAPENFNPHGKILLMCNHQSTADAFTFNRSIFPWEFKWVYKADLLHIPVAGLVLKLAQDIPLYFTKDKGGWGTKPGAVKDLMDRVEHMGEKHGLGTVVFPEGTRSVTGRLQPFKLGFFRFACEHKWDILPVVAHNTRCLWPLSDKLIGCGTAYIMFGDPISPKTGEEPESLRDRVRSAMIELMTQSPIYDPTLDRPLDRAPSTRGQLGAL